MGGAEQLVDFHDLCDIYIANPEIDYGDGWDYASTMAYLRSNPTTFIHPVCTRN